MTSCGKTEYTYDAEGNRIKISEGESEIRYLYDTNQSLPKVIKRTQNGISTIYVYGKELISEKTDDDTSYYHFDYRGSTVALTDKNGKITDKYQYDVYGNSRHTEGESDTPFRYNGSAGVMTDANNLLYMKSRYYNPEILRFISADILTGDIRNTQSLNRYAYCEGNPVSFTDPFGLSREIKLQKQEQIEAAKREQVSEIVHGTLDIAGMTPVVGMAADVLNGVIYIFEGDLVGASFSAVAFIPVIGEVATPSKYGGKLVLATASSGADNVFRMAGKRGDDAAELIINKSDNLIDDFAKEPFLPDEFYTKHLPKQVSPGTTSLPKYDEYGNLKQTKYYDSYGREIMWIDYTDHGRINHTAPHWHEMIYNSQYPLGVKIDHRMDPNVPIR